MSEAKFAPQPDDAKEGVFRIGEYHDPEYFGPLDPSEPGFVPYDNRPKKRNQHRKPYKMGLLLILEGQ